MKVSRANGAGRAFLDLQNRARRERRGTQELLTMYVLERFLARLAASPYATDFVLKGGLLLAALNARRPTADADLLATRLANDRQLVTARIREIAALELPQDDGVRFLIDTATGSGIRETDVYAGVRISMEARVASAAVKLKLDVNFGDPVTPGPVLVEYPRLRAEVGAVRVLGYPIATVLAEKVTTAIDLGAANTRVRDYADIWVLTGIHDLPYGEIRAAVEATAAHRSVPVMKLSDSIGDLAQRRQQPYIAYRRRLGMDGGSLPGQFADVTAAVIAFADPILAASAADCVWRGGVRAWQPGER